MMQEYRGSGGGDRKSKDYGDGSGQSGGKSKEDCHDQDWGKDRLGDYHSEDAEPQSCPDKRSGGGDGGCKQTQSSDSSRSGSKSKSKSKTKSHRSSGSRRKSSSRRSKSKSRSHHSKEKSCPHDECPPAECRRQQYAREVSGVVPPGEIVYLPPVGRCPCGGSGCYQCGGGYNPVRIMSRLPSQAIPLGSSAYSDYGSYREDRPRSPARCDPPARSYRPPSGSDNSRIKSMVVGLSDIRATNSDNKGQIEFTFVRKDRRVAMQIEPFNGILAANGTSYIVINQSINSLPAYPVDFPVRIVYNGIPRMSFMQINPDSPDVIRIYTDLVGGGIGVKMGDTISFPGTCIQWLTIQVRC